MIAEAGPTARVSGLMPPGAIAPEVVDLHAGQVWSVGRRDEGYLAARPHLAATHLAVPHALPDLSVRQLELRVGTVGVAIRSHRGSSVVVDGGVRPEPVVLTLGTSWVSPTPSGRYVDFSVTVLRAEDFGPQDAPDDSGTTLLLQVNLEPASLAWTVGHALAWPCMPCRRRPHNAGWSGRDVAGRLEQLGWTIAAQNMITVLGRQLHGLADRVTHARLTDGRRADQVFPSWPPWLDEESADETRDQKAERRNRHVAEALWRARAVFPEAIDG
ncbi:hypothetical protein [Pseudonocardia zijingensis]|jgi:hypothetical protein|uniref:FHA domain-containing protein n=1 Tax=Pseudonocardia zijingensis TaxID=153376 RepID=A0ABP3YU05_9PSEU